MQKIVPHLWYDKEALEAVDWYVSIFPHSKLISSTSLQGTPSGSVDVASFELAGQEFQAISAGPLFKFNPSISFHVNCAAPREVDAIWEKLLPGGKVLMELDSYPFSQRFGWLQDRYGVSWQVLSLDGAPVKQMITPAIMFVGGVCGKAEEAARFWTSVFPRSSVGALQHYGKDEAPDREGTLKQGHFSLFGMEFIAMDSAFPHAFAFNEAISFIVHCDTQAELDGYWKKLSAVPEAEQCGWLKDKYGVSWQIVPSIMGKLMSGSDQARINRVTQAFLPMKKLDIAALQKAYDGK